MTINLASQGHFIKDRKKIYRFKHCDYCFFKRKWDMAYLGSVIQLELFSGAMCSLIISKVLNPLPWHQIHASASLKTGHFKDKSWNSLCKPGEFCVQ